MNISAKKAATELMQYVDEINMDHGAKVLRCTLQPELI